MAPSPPPATTRPVHPTARAFFDALENEHGSSSISKQQQHNTDKRRSASIQKRSQTLGWRSRYSQEDFYPVSVSQHTFSVKQVQRGEVEGTYGTGATVWPASMVLLKYLERHPILIKNKTVVDLGAGTGVTSLAAALLGAKSVLCTDGCTKVVQLAQENVSKAYRELEDALIKQPSSSNEKERTNYCDIQVREYSWGDGSLNQRFDVILVSDCVLPKLYPIAPLVDALDELLLLDKESVAILSYEHRYYPDYDPRDKFRELATLRGLNVQVLPLSQQDPVYSVDDIEVWQVRRRRTTQE